MKTLFSWCVLFVLLTSSISHHISYNCTSEDVKHSLRFLGFFPCPYRDLNECDMLTMSGVELAMDKINQDPHILSCFKLELLPVFVKDPVQDPTEPYRIIIRRYAKYPFHGVIGPDHPNIAKSIGYICGRLNLLQISYSVTDVSLEETSRYPYFYATIPNDHFINKVRRYLLEHFSWRRVGILSVEEEYYVSVAELLSNSLKRSNSNMTVFDLGSFKTSPERNLKDAKDKDIRIFLLMLGELHARTVFCVAYHLKLTTADHVWILPGMYGTSWWYLEENRSNSNCTNEEILEAINSTLFVDTFPFNMNKKNEAKEILSKIFYNTVVNMSADMTMEDYYSLIIHSKLLNAYDATIALALTWNASLTKIENEFQNDDIFSIIDNPWSYPCLIKLLEDSLKNSLSPYNGLAGIQNFHNSTSRSNDGHGLVTQLSGKTECILGSFDSIVGEQRLVYNVCKNSSRCCDVSWKGGYLPTDGSPYNCSFVPMSFLATVVIMAIWNLVGIFAGLALLVVTFVWRQNKHIKASSPKFNIILNLSCCCMFVDGLILLVIFYMGNKENYKKTLPPLCDASYCLWYVSFTAFCSTLLVKNWRIYRIFRNPRIRHRKYLSDWVLLLLIIIFLFPVIAIVVSRMVVSPRFIIPQYIEVDCPDANVQDITKKIEYHCSSQPHDLWNLIVDIYLIILFITILALALHNLKIISYFKKEGELSSLIIVTFLFFTFFFSFITKTLFTSSVRLEYGVIFFTCLVALIGTFSLTTLYLPKFVAIANDLKKAKQEARLQRTLTTKQLYFQKCEEVNQLKSSILKIEAILAAVSKHTEANENTFLVFDINTDCNTRDSPDMMT